MDTTAKERYVLHHLSLIDMERVVRSLDLLQEIQDDHLRESLFRDAVICYAKPFSSNKGLSRKRSLRVSALFVPAEFSTAHAEILALRNQLFAHMDIDKQAPKVTVETIDGERHISFSVAGYERVFTGHLIGPLHTLAKAAHSFFMQELTAIANDDA